MKNEMMKKTKNKEKLDMSSFCKAGGKSFITLYKSKGKFYSAFDNDAYILCLIFGYKVINGRKCGFPDNALDKVLNKFDEYKISYQIIYDNDKPVIKDYKKLNNYNIFFSKSLFMIDRQNKIDMIIDRIKNFEEDDLEKLVESVMHAKNK